MKLKKKKKTQTRQCSETSTMYLPSFIEDKYGMKIAPIRCRNEGGHDGKHKGWFDFPGTDLQYGVKEWE